MHMIDIAKRILDKIQFSTLNRLKKDMKLMDANKISSNGFRIKWNKHFASKSHMGACDCHGHFCPFDMVLTEEQRKKDAKSQTV